MLFPFQAFPKPIYSIFSIYQSVNEIKCIYTALALRKITLPPLHSLPLNSKRDIYNKWGDLRTPTHPSLVFLSLAYLSSFALKTPHSIAQNHGKNPFFFKSTKTPSMMWYRLYAHICRMLLVVPFSLYKEKKNFFPPFFFFASLASSIYAVLVQKNPTFPQQIDGCIFNAQSHSILTSLSCRLCHLHLLCTFDANECVVCGFNMSFYFT